jgi:hypothetical protein
MPDGGSARVGETMGRPEGCRGSNAAHRRTRPGRARRPGRVIAGGRIQLPLPFQLGSGATVAPPTDGDAALTIASVDRISLSDIELLSGNARVTFDLESSLSGDRLTVSRVRLGSEKTSIEGSGEFSSLAARRGLFATSADPLDLDEVLTIASAFNWPASGESSPAAEGQPLALAPGGVRLEPFGVGAFDGTVDGRLTVDTTGESSRVAVSAAARGQPRRVARDHPWRVGVAVGLHRRPGSGQASAAQHLGG